MSLRDRYVLDARLGVGGMAEVFRARRIGINDFTRAVAVKRMLGGSAASDAFQAMFIAEARLTSQLAHPNIVSVLDFDRDEDGSLCLIMDLVEGCDLARLMKTGLVPFEVVNYIVVEALKGLSHAHSFNRDGVRGIVHRDISPHNLLLSWLGEVKVSDFGLAKTWSRDEATATIGIKGKPAYMSPEQANSHSLDGRSDLFAIGTIMWELLVGRSLFGADDTRASLAAILFGTVPAPRQLRPDVPKDLERVAMKLLQRDRDHRYRTADQAIVDLLSCRTAKADGRALLATTLASRFGRGVPALPTKIERTQTALRTRPPRTWLLALLLAIPVASYAAWRAGTTSDSSDPNAPRRLEPYVALGEVKPPPDFSAYEIQLQYALDPSELPPSCLILLDWLYRALRENGNTDGRFGVELYISDLHRDLAEEVATGASTPRLDSVCRAQAGRVSTQTRRPNPLLTSNGVLVDFQGTNYYATFRAHIK